MPELGSGFLDTCSIQPIPSFGILGHIYPDSNASIVVVVMPEVVLVVLLTGVGWVRVGVRTDHESQNYTLILGVKYQFALKLITVSLAFIIRSSAESVLVYKFDCKINPVTSSHHEWICLGPEFYHILHWIYQYMLGCCIYMYFIFPHRLHQYNGIPSAYTMNVCCFVDIYLVAMAYT